MPNTHLNFPYDAEIFNYDWKNYPDIVLTSMINSGAVVQDGEIASMIANGSNFYAVPYYNVLGGEAEVYNGVDSFTHTELDGGYYNGVVYGRMKSWMAKSFIKDFNSGADPMTQIVNGVAEYWNKYRQEQMVGILEAVFGATDAEFDNHTTNIATTNGTVLDANKIGPTTISDATVSANGDLANGGYALAIMHSVVAARLANLQLLEFSKYTDPDGLTRSLPIGTANGLTVVVNDLVPVDPKISYALTADTDIVTTKTYYTVSEGVYTAVASPKKADIGTYYEKTDAADEYTTYVLGLGALRYASAPVDVPSEMQRDPKTNGGRDMIYTRLREAMHPYGYTFVGDHTTDVGVPNSVLLDPASYKRKFPAKAIYMTRIITNG